MRMAGRISIANKGLIFAFYSLIIAGLIVGNGRGMSILRKQIRHTRESLSKQVQLQLGKESRTKEAQSAEFS